MKDRSIVLILPITLFLAACSGIVTTEPAKETAGSKPLAMTSNAPSPYPAPGEASPVPTSLPYPPAGGEEAGVSQISSDNYTPQPGDQYMHHGQVSVDLTNSRVIVISTETGAVKAILSGKLPNACHFLRASVSKPDESNTISLNVYSLEIPDRQCVSEPSSFSATISLSTYSSGYYTVMVNGQKLGEFDQ